MQYKIIVDKQSRVNPSGEQREYLIDIEELRVKDNIYDSLIVNPDRAYIERKLQLSKYKVLTELETPIIEELGDLDIELFEKENYIYLIDMEGNKFYAEYVIKNDFTDTFVTSIEMNTAINQTAQDIMLSVNKKVNGEDFGTYIQQNAEAIKIAWNQISDFIQLMILNDNVSFAILDKDKNVIMSLDKQGQHFYKEDGVSVFGEIGVKTIEEQDTNGNSIKSRYINFSVDGEYEKQINEGMAWGITTKTDNKFHPIFYIRNFAMGEKNSDASYGELELSSCNLVLNGFGTGIKTGGVLIYGDPGEVEGVTFWDINNNRKLLSISPDNFNDYANIDILDNISFYRNQARSNSFKIGDGENNYCLFTDKGSADIWEVRIWNELYCKGIVSVSGHIYCNNGVEPFSLAEKKKDIEKYNNKAINEIKNTDIYYYNYKEDEENCKRRVGAIIGENYNCSKEIIGTEGKGIDIYSMLSISYKAIQEQQEQIEELQEKDKQKEEIIQNLISRIETLEKEVLNGKN